MNQETVEKIKSGIPKSVPMKYHTLLLENIHDKIGLLADGLLMTHERLVRFENNMNEFKEETNHRLTSIELDVHIIKGDIAGIKEVMATKDDIKPLNVRVTRIEKTVFA